MMSSEPGKKAVARWVELNLIRKCRLGMGGARDHGGEVVLVEDDGFHLDATIFRTVRSPISRAVLKARLRLQPHWKNEAVSSIVKQARSVPRAPDYNAAVLDFMNTQCDFAMEHADGSFMDHLQFCYEYCSAHLATESPVVLLLHSVLGVGTNYFPCGPDKIPILRSLLTPKEFAHVEAFPSVLRLVLRRSLLEDLEKGAAQKATKISMHRVIDNAPICLEIEALWLQLNYQLIHLLDFLPLLDWKFAINNDVFLAPFARLHALLLKNNQLRANVNYNLKEAKPADCDSKRVSLSLGKLIVDYVPGEIQLAIGARQVASFSKAIGHDLTYQFHYA